MSYVGRHRTSGRAQFIGGPYDGRHSQVRLPMGWIPLYVCAATDDGVWHHYGHVGANGYLYIGSCATVLHGDVNPLACRCGDCGGCR